MKDILIPWVFLLGLTSHSKEIPKVIPPKIETSVSHKARSPVSLEEFSSDDTVLAFISFLSCRDRTTPEKIAICVRSTVAAKNQAELYQWIVMPYRIREVRDCSDGEVSSLSTGFPERTRYAACFKVSLERKFIRGIAFFTRESGKLKVLSLMDIK